MKILVIEDMGKTAAFLRRGLQESGFTVYFNEPDGDKEKLILVREEGQWKAWMAMPKPR